MRICVIGLGRVGLPTAARAAAAGHAVLGVDEQDPAPLLARAAHEPGLARLVADVVQSGQLRLARRPEPADAYLICVGTPRAPSGGADLSAVDRAVRALLPGCPPAALVVLESTVPVGTTEQLAARIRRERPDARVAVAPERVLPGSALAELAANPRVVGGVDPESAAAARDLLASFGSGPITCTDPRTAELAKLVENAARDVEIALANTVADLARAHGIDPFVLRDLVNHHPRVELRQPGIGVGGHCLPVDPWFLVDAHPGETRLLRAARAVNDLVPAQWETTILRRAEGRTVGLLGLGYKPDSDDLRAAPAVEIVRRLRAEARVLVADPYHTHLDGEPLASVDDVLVAPVVVLLVAHRAYVPLRERLGADQLAIDACGGWR